MPVQDFDYSTLSGPAAARRTTFVRRAAHNVACAVGLSLISGSLIPLFVNLPLLLAMLALDVEAGQRFLRAAPERKRVAALTFMAMSVAAITTYALMAFVGALLGGADGRLAAMFLAAGSLVTIIVLMVEAPLYMLMSAAPSVLLLATLPLLPDARPSVHGLASTIGLYLTFLVFAHQLYRTATHHVHLFERNRRSRQEADRRREEAEAHGREADERRREAEKASRVKGEFLTTMTHELRTPLNAVINYAEMIEEEATDAVADYARSITRSGRHLACLVERILEFSDIQEGKIRLGTTEFDLVELAQSVLADQRELMLKNNNLGGVRCSELHAPVVGDRQRIRQCVEVLVSNAAKFTANGRVEIVIEPSGSDWSVVVSDTGEGIGRARLEEIFEPFAQADASHTRRVDGLGLGLASARAVARLMHGDISVESIEGQGSHFLLKFPQRMEWHRPLAAA